MKYFSVVGMLPWSIIEHRCLFGAVLLDVRVWLDQLSGASRRMASFVMDLFPTE